MTVLERAVPMPVVDEERARAIWSAHFPNITWYYAPLKTTTGIMSKDNKVISVVLKKTVDTVDYEKFVQAADYIWPCPYDEIQEHAYMADKLHVPLIGIVYFPKSNAIIYATIRKDNQWKLEVDLRSDMANILMANAVFLKG